MKNPRNTYNPISLTRYTTYS